jgi:hypothetical protein
MMKITSLCILSLLLSLLIEPDDPELIDALLNTVAVLATLAEGSSCRFLGIACPKSVGCFAGGLSVK